MTSTNPRGPDEYPVGRRPQLDDTLTDTICGHLATGSTMRAAALASGVSERAVHKWVQRGQAELARLDTDDDELTDLNPTEARYVRFVLQAAEAEAKAETQVVQAWHAAATGTDADWRAGRDFLARRHPHTWGQRTSLTVSREESDARVEAALGLIEQELAATTDPDDDQEPDRADT